MKGLGEKNGDFSKITDAARASLVFDDAYSLDRSLKNLNYVAVKKGHQIVESEDFIVKSGTFHIKFLINIKLDDKKDYEKYYDKFLNYHIMSKKYLTPFFP